MWLRRHGDEQTQDTFLRGDKFIETDGLIRLLQQRQKSERFGLWSRAIADDCGL